MLTSILVAATLGVLTWTLLEYCIHRWLGHDARLRPNLFEVEHTRHHAEGNYFAATAKKLRLAVLVMGLLAPPAVYLAGPVPGAAWAVGTVGAYLLYEWLHLDAHMSAPRTAYGRWLRLHHFWHHFGNPGRNHGVTSPLWDVVFGTRERPRLPIAVPRKLAMRWIVDPATFELSDAAQGLFRLRGAAPAAPTDAGVVSGDGAVAASEADAGTA